jgi:hypothetical protein
VPVCGNFLDSGVGYTVFIFETLSKLLNIFLPFKDKGGIK